MPSPPRPQAALALLAAAGLAACSAGSAVTSSTQVTSTSAPTSAAGDGPDPGAASPGSPAPLPGMDTAPSGPRYPLTGDPAIVDGIDWRMPEWARPAPNSGFFSESASAPDGVLVRAIDQSWRQLQPTEGRTVYTDTGSAQAMSFEPLDQALAGPGDYWMRIFASGVDWAPEWLPQVCGVDGYAPDYDGMSHLPIWDDCVWEHLLALYRDVFVTKGLRADPRLRFVWVPGAFTWAEFDSETINDAIATGELTKERYLEWFRHAWTDLAEIFGPYKNKLVFTGEDYTWAEGLGDEVATLAERATEAGIGIRNGIPELFNFHLNEAPAYGSRVQPDGHLTVDESLPIHDGTRIVAMENECFTDCGFSADGPELEYAVTQTNLKSLQLRANWIYVVPTQSKMGEFPELWDWVRLSIGHTARTAPDAWAVLREAEDVYWADNDLPPFDGTAQWRGKPWVRNLERWVVQRDVPGALAHSTDVDVHSDVFTEENGTAREGLSTGVADGDDRLAFDVDDRFVESSAAGSDVVVLVTFWDGGGPFRVGGSAYESATVAPAGARAWRTATVTMPVAALDGDQPGGSDLAVIAEGDQDVIVRFVRVVRLAPPR